MTSQRPFSKETSDNGVQADAREFKRRCINTLADLKISYTRLLAYLNRSRNLPNTDRYLSLDPIRHQWAELETLLLYTIPEEVLQINTPHSSSLQLPTTGDIPEILDDVTQGQPSKQTTSQPQEMTKQEVILRGQEAIRKYFHTHAEQMPLHIRMNLKNSIKITDVMEEGKFFPETHVLVRFDLLLDDDQFICA